MRRPAVAGQFYPSLPRQLEQQINRYFTTIEVEELVPAKGAVVPHAGYVYSGRVAAEVFARLPVAETYVIIGPNHTGYGSPIAVSGESWATPLGVIESDMDLVNALPRRIIDLDETAHRYEHSVEVQLPFIQKKFPGARMMAICMGLQDEESAQEVGEDVAEAIEQTGRNTVVIASSDFTHFLTDKNARDIDNYVIEAILGMDIEEMYRRVYERSASVCGFGPIAAMLHAAKKLGAEKAELATYTTSAEVSGDTTNVVGYGGILVR